MIRYAPALHDLLRPADEIKPHPRNPNNGDTDALIASILQNGVYRPIFVSAASAHILAGHHLYAALLELGEELVPVQWIDDLTPEDELRILLADNRIAQLAKIDQPQLLDLLDYLDRNDTLMGTGYDEDYLERLRETLDRDDEPLRFDPEPEPELTIACPHCGATFDPHQMR